MDDEKKDIEDFVDSYVEGSFSLRDSEVQFKLKIGEALAEVEDLRPYAKAIKKHVSFLETCIGVYKKWSELEKTYTKEKSWSDLVKEAGLGEKRPRRMDLIRNRIRQNYYLHKDMFERTGNLYDKGRLDEDDELLQPEQEHK